MLWVFYFNTMEATNYFQHDYRSRLDKKLLKIRMKHHMAGVGVYWCLVEMLHEGNGFIEMDTETIAYELQCEEQIVKDVIEICFEYVEDMITCNRVIENLEFRQQKWEAKSQKGKEAADKRWEEYRKQKGNVSQTYTEPMGNLYQTYTNPMPNYAIEKEKEKEKDKEIVIGIDKWIDNSNSNSSNEAAAEFLYKQLTSN
jgi:hypothetical protein